MLPQFQINKDNRVALTINTIIQRFVEKMKEFKRNDLVGMLIHHDSEDDIVMNRTINVLSNITCGGCTIRA